MIKKIMLIKPAYETDAVWDTIRTSQPLGLWWMASHLKERGHQVRLLDETVRSGGSEKKVLFRREVMGATILDQPLDKDYNKFQIQKMQDFNTMTPEEFVDHYSAFHNERIVRTMVRTGNPIEKTLHEVAIMNPDYVGIPIFASCNYQAAIDLAKAVKDNFPKTKVVMGGQHVSALPQEILKLPFVDYIITGDAVEAMTNLVERGSPLLCQLNGGVSDINSFPLLDMELMKENEYPLEPTHSYTTQGRKAVDYMFSKGCLRDCEFCVAGGRENKISTTQLEKIDQQLQRFKDEGIEEIIVQDDAFLYKPNQNLKEFLRLMKNHGLYWQDNGGIEFEGLSSEVLEMFRQYQNYGQGRINSLYIPLNPRSNHRGESAFKDMETRFSSHFSHIKQLRESGIYVCTSEIIGYPGQTKETMEEDIKLHQELVKSGYADKSMTFVTSTLPGTKLHREQHQNIVNPYDWAGYSNFVPQSTTNSVKDIKEIERITIERNQEMNKVQKSFSWGSAFPNV